MTDAGPALARRLGLGGAVAIGLGSMIGAGVFAVLAPAAQAAGAGLLIGLAIAAAVAVANASSSAQLAAQYPSSGGAYVYGRERLGEWPGFLAGWSFVVGKSASCAAMALTAAAYLAPPGCEKPVGLAAVVALTAVNCLGITRTATAAKLIVAFVLAVLALVVAGGTTAGVDPGALAPTASDALGVLQSAGLLFFAFAGYARIATLGEEVRDPARTIPRAILIALAVALLVYAAVAVIALGALGAPALAASTQPLADVVAAAGWHGAVPVVSVGAAVASLGALLALLAGVGRTSLAMARTGDLPRPLAAVNAWSGVPVRAELAIGVVVCALVLLTDLRGAIGFSSFGVLLYYLVANLAALTQAREHRRFPRALAVFGALGCVGLAVLLPLESVVGGCVVVAAGVGIRAATKLVRKITKR